MNAAINFSSQLLTTSAAAYAGLASSELLENHPEIEGRYAPNPLALWKHHLTQRLFELAAALESQEPRILTARVQWAQKAFRARDQPPEDLRHGLLTLRGVLSRELPPMAQKSTLEYLDSALSSLDGASETDELLSLDPEQPLDRLALSYLKACLEGDVTGAIEQVRRAIDGGLSLGQAYAGILVAAQREVGALWHLGEINVAEEHLVTTTTERTLSVLAQDAERQPSIAKTVLAAAVSGNGHGLGVRILADLFEIAGWRSICLGADVPADDLISSTVYFNADLVLLSAALPTHLKALRQTIEGLRKLPDMDVKVLVGGRALDDAPDLWKKVGADGHAVDIAQIVPLGGRLVGLS